MLLEVISQQLLELEQEHIAEEKARKKETAGEEKEPPRKCTMNDLAEAFADLCALHKKFENVDPDTERFSVVERNIHGGIICLEANL